MSTTLRFEVRRLFTLATPVIITQVATMMLSVVDTMMVGHVDVDTLAAASLGHVWTFGTLIFAMGVLFGMDPIVTQAHGAGDGARMGVTLQRGLVVAALLSLPVAALWMSASPLLQLLGQEPRLAERAQTYAMVQIPSIPFFLAFTALRQYLQGRGIVTPALWVAIIANLVNVALNWALVFGNLGAPALGLTGAGLATGGTRVFLCAALVVLVLAGNLHADAWTPWTRRALRPGALREILRYGLPVGVQFSLEVWAFQITTLLAGRLGAIPLGAHTVVLNLASLSFMFPLGMSLAATTRVGNLMGAGDRDAAQRTAWIAFALGAGMMSLFAITFITLRHQLPGLFTPDAAILALAASILPIAGAFQLFDGIQVVGSGVLRGIGSTAPAAVFNLLGYYAFALPLAIWLAFGRGMGLSGLWWGLCGGLGAVSVMLLLWVRRRGPAHATAIPVDLAP